MRKWAAIVGTAVFFVVAPGVVAGLIPYWITGWRLQPGLLDHAAVRGVGVVAVVAGLVPLIESFARFALEGHGTPAPVFATRWLVVTGFYRYVRNPMYVGVLAVIVGQVLLFGEVRLLAYAAVVWLCFHLFTVAYEEPTLRRTYGTHYDAYAAAVPRWIPRLAPWRADQTG
jgi:protein-S-isoprenylcysteine O-methyltransferase Ste14